MLRKPVWAAREAPTDAAMHLYNLTLQKASGITAACFGNFSGPKQQELVVARGKILELMRPDDNGKVQTVCAMEIFGIVRSMATFRLTGERPPALCPLAQLSVRGYGMAEARYSMRARHSATPRRARQVATGTTWWSAPTRGRS